MKSISQVIAVIQFAIQTIPQRKASSITTVVGIAGVVAVMIGVFSIALGFQRTMNVAGDESVAMIMRSGSDSEMMSGLTRESTRVIADDVGLARNEQGSLSSAELFVIINLPKRDTGTDANVPLRGVEAQAFNVRGKWKLIEGRAFAWGTNEVVVGRAAAAEFAGLDVGSSIQMGPNKWQVVGIFEESGGISESEIWTDSAVLQPAYHRGDTFQSVYAKLNTADIFPEFKNRLESDPRLDVKVIRQTEYYAEQSGQLSIMIKVLGGFIAFLMALGAVFGAANTMYAAVTSRTREIATLRALGFSGPPIILSVLAESLFLSLLGGAIGATLAYLAMDGYQAATLNWTTFSQVAFAFTVNKQLIIAGLIVAGTIGFVGGLFPAYSASRIPLAAALREN
ncbi:MAG: ABC transporter permease [Acidobacteria bacterium]|nr:ABC transporter permease [Acidobacteriota bacterium]